MTTLLAIAAYAVSMTIANLTVAHFGVWVAPINAFFLIGLDLTLRDWLHVRLGRAHMLALIVATSLLTWVLNADAGRIAVASACAFGAAALVDWMVFAKMRGTWLRRANGSNVAGAAVDSLLFPTLAFGSLMPGVIALQFAAKVAGGALWAMVLRERAVIKRVA